MNDQSVLSEAPATDLPIVNDGVSWQAKLTTMLLRRVTGRRFSHSPNITSMRTLAKKVDRWAAGKVRGVEIEDRNVAAIPCRWLKGPVDSQRVLLYLHGGGFVIHLPRTYDAFATRLAREIGASALIPDYRLAPEHPFPAAVEDCLTSYRWLLDQGYSADQIVIAGDSAGGCLTLTTLLQIRDAGLPKPAAAVLLSPGTDCRRQALFGEPELESGDPVLSTDALDFFLSAYLTGDDSDTNPLVSPVFGDYHDMPPIQFHVGSTEMILDHTLRVAERVSAAGGDAGLHVWKAMPHVHPLISWLPESKQALSMMGQFLRKHLA
ncbi:MAG: alpha/beta hydrolase [Motiliproteus sp.]